MSDRICKADVRAITRELNMRLLASMSRRSHADSIGDKVEVRSEAARQQELVAMNVLLRRLTA